MLDCTQLTYGQMADLVRAIAIEVKNRNALFVNAYVAIINGTVDALDELHDMKLETPDMDEQ